MDNSHLKAVFGYFRERAIQCLLLLGILAVSGCRNAEPSPKPVELTPIETFFQYTPDREVLVGAHRGGMYSGYPENCLETMQFVSSRAPGTIHEIDINRTRDGALILMHDDAVDRTTTGTGRVDQLALDAILDLRLVDAEKFPTSYSVPVLQDVLRWAVTEKVILMLDIKRSVTYEEVLQTVLAEGAVDHCVFIVHSAAAAKKLASLHPQIMLSVNIRNQDEWVRFRETGIPPHRIVAFTGTVQSPLALFDTLHAYGMMGILGTLGNLDRQAKAKGAQLYKDWARSGVDMFSTDRPIEVYLELSRKEL